MTNFQFLIMIQLKRHCFYLLGVVILVLILGRGRGGGAGPTLAAERAGDVDALVVGPGAVAVVLA